MRLIDAIYWILKYKRQGRVEHKSIDSMLHWMANYLLPDGNLLPPSLHLCKRVLQVKSWREKERHVCDSCDQGHLFQKRDKKHWNCDEKCPHCSETRFVLLREGGVNRLRPRAWFIDLGLEDAIKSMFEDTWWTKQRGQHRDVHDEASYWASKECQRMKQTLPDFDSEKNSPYDLLLDWVEPYNSATHSVGLMAIRSVITN